jgi:hypothetical protein
VTKSGELIIHMMQRTGKLEATNIEEILLGTAASTQLSSSSSSPSSSAPPLQQQLGINTSNSISVGMASDSLASNQASAATFGGVVRKSQLLLDQSAREKVQAVDMHRAFQVRRECPFILHCMIALYFISFILKYDTFAISCTHTHTHYPNIFFN